MAIVDMARFKPDRGSSLESLVSRNVVGGNGTPGSGTTQTTVYLPVQIITFDDTKLTIATHEPGDPNDERFITVLDEDTLQVAAEGFAGMTAAAVLADLQARLDTWASGRRNDVPMLRRIIRAAKKLPPRAIV
jgi:hypothetical protein